MKKSLYGGSAVTAAALIAASFFTYAKPLLAETNPFQQASSQQQKREESQNPTSRAQSASGVSAALEAATNGAALAGKVVDAAEDSSTSETASPIAAAPEQTYVATAYSLRGRTASGRMVAKGLIAADPSVLPLGSRVRLDAGPYTGEYLVADTGGAVRGRHIDIWTPSTSEALRFGRRKVKLTVLSYGVARRPRKIRS